MSTQQPQSDEQDQVDFIPDSPDTGDDEQPNVKSCNKCFRASVCYPYYRMKNLEAELKNLKFVRLPYEPEIIATECELYLPKNNVRMVDMDKEESESKDD